MLISAVHLGEQKNCDKTDEIMSRSEFITRIRKVDVVAERNAPSKYTQSDAG